jgi:hypothetical protein
MKELEWNWHLGEENEKLVILPSSRRRILHRCVHRGEKGRCRCPAEWKVQCYYDGRLERTLFLCSLHMRKWEEALVEDERRGVLSHAWSYEVNRLVSRKTLRRWLKLLEKETNAQ